MTLFPWQREALRRGDPPGIAMALFAGLLLLGLCGGLAGVVFSLTTLTSDARFQRALVRDQIVPPHAELEAWITPTGDAAASEGCLIADDALILWRDRERVGAVALLGARVEREGDDLIVHHIGEALRCPVGRGPLADAFTDRVRLRTQEPAPRRPAVEPTDPRLRRHLGLDDP